MGFWQPSYINWSFCQTKILSTILYMMCGLEGTRNTMGRFCGSLVSCTKDILGSHDAQYDNQRSNWIYSIRRCNHRSELLSRTRNVLQDREVRLGVVQLLHKRPRSCRLKPNFPNTCKQGSQKIARYINWQLNLLLLVDGHISGV